MLISAKIDNVLMPLMAPPGSAAYAVSTTPNTATIIFAMMKKGESGLDTLIRVRKENGSATWLPVESRPEQQIAVVYSDDPFVAYQFVKEDDAWVATNAALVSFLKAMNMFQSLPGAAPKELGATFESFVARPTDKTKARRQ